MNKLLTIVVPVYKVEPYINKCLDSLLIYKEDGTLNERLMSLMDILIVNDGTPDRSAEMSREYVAKYPQYFRQIDKENGGHGSVWNLGVKEAYGKYVKFLDSDDWLENLDQMLIKLEQTDADLITTSCICHCENNELWKLEIKDMEFDKVYDADAFDWLGNRSHGNYVLHHCAIYKTEIFRQYLPLFLEKQPYDDVVLGAAPIIGAKTFVAWDLEVYHYLMDRPGQSISQEVQNRNKNASIKTQKHTIEFIINHPITDQNSSKYSYFANKLPKKCNYGYRNMMDYAYADAKKCSKEWNKWLKGCLPTISTPFVRLYRRLPFCMYYIGYKLFDIIRGKRN